MSIPLSQLYTPQHNPYELTLLAGQNGLTREVSWIQVMEEATYASFLMPNELIFTTGLGSSPDSQWLLSFVKALIEAGTTALVINVGKYIVPAQISQAVLQLCNDRAFPLFIMPWHIRLADVTQAFLSSLFLTKQKEYDVVQACKELFCTQNGQAQAWQVLRLHGFEEQAAYQVLAVAEPNLADGQITRYKGYVNEQLAKYIVLPGTQGYVVVAQVRPETSLREVAEQLAGHSETARYGLGMIVHSLREVVRSYEQAVQAAAWAVYRKERIQDFTELGIYALLGSLENELVMQTLHDTYLGPLLAYDRDHHRALYETLESFLRHDGSLQAVAAETYSHRNTVLYRMKRIKALLQTDFADGEARFPYQLACYIHRYLAFKRNCSLDVLG